MVSFFNKSIINLKSARVIYFKEIEVRGEVGGDRGEVM
jgi:hypothetical protein